MIKKRKGWSVYMKPWAPSAPRKPEKTIIDVRRVPIHTVDRCSEFKLSDILAFLPYGVKLDEVRAEINAERGYDDDTDVTINFYSTVETVSDNPNYEKQLKEYNKEYQEWKKEKSEYAKEVKEWKLWVEQEEKLDLERRLKRAQDLLTKHGQKVSHD